MRIPGCCVGNHCEKKIERPEVKSSGSNYMYSPNEPPKSGPMSHSAPTPQPKIQDTIPFRTPEGRLKCSHAGCMKDYDEADNSDGACHYHPGKAGFRDTRKFWSCCNASSYDWDEFMKIPTCCTGKHEPKRINSSTSNS
jgi:hypothetical protein